MAAPPPLGKLSSMTGFGSAEERAERFVVGVDIRTVNNRYFKLQSRFPDELAPLAGPAEAEVRGSVKRGSAYLTVRFELLAEGGASAIDESLFGSYAEVCKRLAKKHGLAQGAMSAADILRLPGVIPGTQEAATFLDLTRIEPVFRAALGRALKALAAMREREGQALQAELLERVALVDRLLDPIEAELPVALLELEAKLEERVNEILSRRGIAIDKSDLAREMAFLAERTDITEEIERIRSHVVQTRDALTQGGEVGRQLDFLSQELLREATTMGAKAGTCALADRVLALKVEIDRIKEQAQNIE